MAKTYGDKWETVRDLDTGGQAHTYVVRDKTESNKGDFVLKRLINTNRVERFQQELEALQKLEHPNILKLIDYQIEAQKPYIVTEFCEGGTLGTTSFWKDDVKECFRLFREICEGVLFAHENNIIHRDLKPENIFIRSNNSTAVVGDFGLCYYIDGKRSTLTDEAVGSRNYMAPELEDGIVEKVSKKSDVYALGKILYYLLSNGKVFSREKHREPNFDLKNIKQNPDGFPPSYTYMEHANNLLDVMIVHESDQRRDLRDVIGLSRQFEKLIVDKFNPLHKFIEQLCIYCGKGYYLPDNDVRNFGLNMIGSPIWKIFVCNHCGNTQLFRLDKTDNEGKNWKK